MKNRYPVILIICALLSFSRLCAQDSLKNGQVLTLPKAFELALKNSVQLSISRTETSLAHQAIELNKLGQLPGISLGLNYGYISNADIWTPSFSEHQKGAIPHQFTQLTTQAGEVIFKGGEVRNNIRKATLDEQIAALALEKNTEDIKFLVAGQYLDIYRFINLRQVYVNNVKLAENRLKNILVMEKQGMVTQNDVLRTELTLSDLQLAIRKTDNNIAILNNQMNMVLGLPADATFIPDSTVLNLPTSSDRVGTFIETGSRENHELKIASTKVRIAETSLKLLGSDRYPSFTVFAGSSLQRPFLYSIPSIDIFYNIWQAGIGLSYNISSIYQSPRKIKAGKIQLQESMQYKVLQEQSLEVDIRNHYIKFKEAEDELLTSRKDLKSAEENYRIVEKKYFNQLALLTDLIDATTTKIDAETKVTNAEINKIYAYYLLLKASSGSIGI
jgi:outer membrane protein